MGVTHSSHASNPGTWSNGKLNSACSAMWHGVSKHTMLKAAAVVSDIAARVGTEPHLVQLLPELLHLARHQVLQCMHMLASVTGVTVVIE